MNMKIKPVTVALAVSFTLNALTAWLIVAAAVSHTRASSISFPAVEDGYVAAAAVVVFPASSQMVFNPVDLTLKPAQKTYLQYAVVAANRQTNLFVSALYDPQILAIEYTGGGVLITALREGETLLQYIANDGIKDLARISVTK